MHNSNATSTAWRTIGTLTCQNTRKAPAPSSWAASSTDDGICWKAA